MPRVPPKMLRNAYDQLHAFPLLPNFRTRGSMKIKTTFTRLAACLLFCTGGFSATVHAADAKASMVTMQIPSHGSPMNGLVYVAAGAGPHPVVILLHGFPGNERNLDLAQDMRRAGWDVLFFNYRGSWGTPGDFSFSHSME